MPLGLIFLQHVFDPKVESTVELGQTVAEILVHGGLGYPELFRRLAHRRLVLDDVCRQSLAPLLHVFLHSPALPRFVLGYLMHPAIQREQKDPPMAGPLRLIGIRQRL